MAFRTEMVMRKMIIPMPNLWNRYFFAVCAYICLIFTKLIFFQGLYYSYFKTVIEAPTFLKGVEGLYANTLTEYPNTINTLKRFNLYPEVFPFFLPITSL